MSEQALGHISEWVGGQGLFVLTLCEPSIEDCSMQAAHPSTIPCPCLPGRVLHMRCRRVPDRGEQYDLVICQQYWSALADPGAALQNLAYSHAPEWRPLAWRIIQTAMRGLQESDQKGSSASWKKTSWLAVNAA